MSLEACPGITDLVFGLALLKSSGIYMIEYEGRMLKHCNVHKEDMRTPHSLCPSLLYVCVFVCAHAMHMHMYLYECEYMCACLSRP